jgi:hypothetical protein
VNGYTFKPRTTPAPKIADPVHFRAWVDNNSPHILSVNAQNVERHRQSSPRRRWRDSRRVGNRSAHQNFKEQVMSEELMKQGRRRSQRSRTTTRTAWIRSTRPI